MYIDEADQRDLVTETVNRLHCLNYKINTCILCGCYFLRPEMNIRSDIHVIWSEIHVAFGVFGSL